MADLQADLAAAEARDPRILPKHWVMLAASAVIIENGKLLLVRDLQGFWAGVGGWIDPAETPEEAVVREVREELGVGAEVIRHLRPFIAWHVAQLDDPVSFLLFPHRVKLASREFKPDPGEVTDIAWAEPGRLDEYPMLPYVRGLYNDRLTEWLAH